MGAYTISDRGTWLSFGNKRELAALVEGDSRRVNRYDAAASRNGCHRPRDKQRSAPIG
jgi:ABC-type tungstate transport system permease subunit